MDKPSQRVKIAQQYSVEYPDSINVKAGERLKVGREDDEFPGWKWCKASHGRQVWVPVELLLGEGAEAMVAQDYSARELEVRIGEEVVVEDADRTGC